LLAHEIWCLHMVNNLLAEDATCPWFSKTVSSH